MVQHILPLMLELYHQKQIKLQTIEKMCHAPARLFQIEKDLLKRIIMPI